MTKLENRSLDRGITILEILARTGANTLADLHHESGIPKSTIRRLLGTLQARRLVRRSLLDKKYRNNITLPASVDAPIPKDMALYVDIAVPILSELTLSIEWPSDVQIIDGYTMRMIDSTRPLSPFLLYRSLVNRTLNIFGTATGQVCLAAMSEAKVDEFIENTRGDKTFGLDRFGLTRETLFAELETIHIKGYGIRNAKYLGETVLDDGLAAIAVPILKQSEPIGAISLIFPRRLATPSLMARDYLEKLKNAADRITADLEQYS